MRSWQLWLGLAVSLAAVVYLARTVDPAELGSALGRADPLLIGLCIATMPIAMYFKAWRQRLFFPDPSKVSMRGLLAALWIGYMVNTVVPLRAGEVVRAFLVGQSEGVSKSTALATVLVEKVLDLATVAFLFFLLQFAVTLPDWAVAGAWLSGIGLAVATAVMTMALLARGLSLRLAEAAERGIPILRRLHPTAMLQSFLDGLAFVDNRRVLAVVVASSIGMWLFAGLTIYLGLAGAGIWERPGVAMLVLVVTNLGMAVPSAPGYVGVYHSAVVLALAAFGVESGPALAAALILHAAGFGTFIVGGMYYLLRASRGGDRVGLGGLLDRARAAPDRAPAP